MMETSRRRKFLTIIMFLTANCCLPSGRPVIRRKRNRSNDDVEWTKVRFVIGDSAVKSRAWDAFLV